MIDDVEDCSACVLQTECSLLESTCTEPCLELLTGQPPDDNSNPVVDPDGGINASSI
jgi:hypothetical protein